MSAEIFGVKATSFLGTIAPSIFGALISLRFLPNEATITNKISSYLAAVVIAYYWGNGLSNYLQFKAGSMEATAIVFTFGVFGLTITSHLWTEIPKFIASARIKWLGGSE